MGTVYEGMDERLERRVAVKVLKEEYADDPRSVERFVREARAAGRLNHPNIAQVFDSGQDAGQHFIVMEFVNGVHLGQLLDTKRRLAPHRAGAIAGQVCAALGAAHAAGIVHRDIKPGNVLIGSDDRVKVTDFGIARAQGEAALTGSGLVLGTAQYVSPEQGMGQEATPASDLYSTGILLYQMLTGSVPFAGESPVAVALSHVTQQVPPVDAVVSDTPPRLAAVVARATNKNPQLRYADAAEMGADLRHALTMRPTGPAETAYLPLEAAQVSSRPPRPPAHRAWIVAAGTVLLIGTIMTAWLLLSDEPATRTAERTPASQPSQDAKNTRTPQEPAATGPIVPANAVGRDAKALEERLKERGYDVHKVDLASAEAKESVLATVPRPGESLAAGQTVVLIASKGEAPDGSVDSAVPSGIVGSNASEAEELLKDEGLEVEKVEIASDRPKDTVVGTYPSTGVRAAAGTVVILVSAGE